jgi:hypothetical protein
VKARLAITRCGHDRHRVVHQALDVVVGDVARIRPRARRIAALARRNGAIARRRKGGYLRAPAMHGFGEAVQEEDQWRAGIAGGEGVEGEGGGGGDLGKLRHGWIPKRIRLCQPLVQAV